MHVLLIHVEKQAKKIRHIPISQGKHVKSSQFSCEIQEIIDSKSKSIGDLSNIITID